MKKENYKVEGGYRWSIKSEDLSNCIWYGFSFTPSNSGGMFAKNHSNGFMLVYFEHDLHGEVKRVEFKSSDYPELRAKYYKDASKAARVFIKTHVKPLVEASLNETKIN